MSNIGARKMFALVVETATKEPRRVIDTSHDQDDSFLLVAQRGLAADETIYFLPIDDYPIRRPIIVAKALWPDLP